MLSFQASLAARVEACDLGSADWEHPLVCMTQKLERQKDDLLESILGRVPTGTTSSWIYRLKVCFVNP